MERFLLIFIFVLSLVGLGTTLISVFNDGGKFIGVHCVLLVMFTAVALVAGNQLDKEKKGEGV
jgi:hypothetical protein